MAIHTLETSPLLQIGDTIEVNRQPCIVRQVREGGMGFVFLLDNNTGPLGGIAAKTFRPEFPLSQIVSELNIWLKLLHLNILRLDSITVIEFETAAVSPWRRRGSLHEYLVTEHRLEHAKVKQVLTEATTALRFVWDEHHVLHLDVKPHNILLSDVPWKMIEIADWGLARISSSTQLRIAQVVPHEVRLATSYAGTIPYMAPERFISGVQDTIQADIFSLGILAIECLSGSVPFTHRTNLIEQILSGDYMSLSAHAVKDCSPRWRDFIARCLAYNRDHRFQTYQEMQKALSRL